MKNRAFTLIELLIVIAIIGVLAAVVIASLNSARTRARTSAIKVEAKQLMDLAMEHYFERGSFSSFGSYGWTKGDTQDGTSATTCSTRIGVNALNRDKAIEVCNSMLSKLPTNLSTGSAANKMLIGCNASHCDPVHNWGIKVKLQDNEYQTGSNAGNYFCVGSSGAIYQGLYSIGASGCVRNP